MDLELRIWKSAFDKIVKKLNNDESTAREILDNTMFAKKSADEAVERFKKDLEFSELLKG